MGSSHVPVKLCTHFLHCAWISLPFPLQLQYLSRTTRNNFIQTFLQYTLEDIYKFQSCFKPIPCISTTRPWSIMHTILLVEALGFSTCDDDIPFRFLSGDVSYFFCRLTSFDSPLTGEVECLWGSSCSGDDSHSLSSILICADVSLLRLWSVGRANARSAWSFSGSLVQRSRGDSCLSFSNAVWAAGPSSTCNHHVPKQHIRLWWISCTTIKQMTLKPLHQK